MENNQPDRGLGPIVKDGLHYIGEALLALVFPPLCSFCDSMEADPVSSLCGQCRESVTEIRPPFCFQCGMPFPGVSREGVRFCGRCLSDPPRYSRTRYAVEYVGSVREGLVRFKYSGGLHLTRAFSTLLIEAFHRHFHLEEFDLIVPIPIHRKRLVQRGFNQAIILAERLADATGVSFDRTALRKIRDTRPQVGLLRSERLKNLRGSFGIAGGRSVRGKNVLVVDDVVTTGSTIGEAARTLMAAGASSVDALVLAVRKSGPNLVAASHQLGAGEPE